MKIRNYTPHEITIFSAEDCYYDKATRKHYLRSPEVEPLARFPSSGMLSASYKDATERVLVDGTELMLVRRTWSGVDQPPHADDDTYLIVSSLYVAAAKACGYSTAQLLTIGDPVYESPAQPRPVGCLKLVRN